MDFLQDYIALTIAVFFGLAALTAKIMNIIMNATGKDDHPYLSWLIGGAAGSAIFVISSMNALIPAFAVSVVIAVIADLVLTKVLEKPLDKAADKLLDSTDLFFGKIDNRDIRKIMTSPDKAVRVKYMSMHKFREFKFHVNADFEAAKQALLRAITDSGIDDSLGARIVDGELKGGGGWVINIKQPRAMLFVVLEPREKLLVRVGLDKYNTDGLKYTKERMEHERKTMTALDDLRFLVSDVIRKLDPAFTMSFEK